MKHRTIEYVSSKVYFSQLNKFRNERKYSDMTIIIDGIVFPCHRNVLASASTFFDTMLGGRYDESERREITMDSVSAACFDNVLNFIYRQPMDINPSNSFELLSAARFFRLEEMEKHCVEYVMQNIPEKHVFETCTFAKLSNKKHLYAVALAFVARNFAVVCNQEAFLEISYEILADVVSHAELDCFQDIILNSITRWAEGKKVSLAQMSCLLSNVSTGEYVAKLICKSASQSSPFSGDSLNQDNPSSDYTKEVDSLYESVVRYIAENMSILHKSIFFLQISYDLIKAVFMHPNLNGSIDELIDLINRWTKDHAVSKDQVRMLFFYVLRKSRCKQISNYLTAAACSCDSSLLHIHAVEYPYYKIVELTFDECTLKWQKIDGRYTHKAYYQRSVSMHGCLFSLTVENADRRIPFSVGYSFQVKNEYGSWRNLKTPAIRCTDRFNMVVARGAIYLHTFTDCLTDRNALGRVNVAESYESGLLFTYVYNLNEWFLVKRLADEDLYNLLLVCVDDELYFVGVKQSDSTSCMFWYDQISQWWRTAPRPLRGHYDGAVCAHQGKLYLHGGDSKVLEVYDPVSRCWKLLQSSHDRFINHHLVSYGNKLWAFGVGWDLPVEYYNTITNVWTRAEQLRGVLDMNDDIIDVFVA